MISTVLGVLAVWFIMALLAAAIFVNVIPREKEPTETIDLTGHRWRS